MSSANTDSVPSTNSKVIRDVVSNLFKTAELSVLVAAVAKPTDANALEIQVPKPIVVLGSGGQTGRLIVDYLVKKKVYVRPTYRANLPTYEDEVVDKPRQVDVTKKDSIEQAISGAAAVIFAASASKSGGSAEQVDFQGVANVAEICVRNKIPRLIVISSGAISKPDSLGFKFTNIFGKIMEFKLKGENALKSTYAASGDSSLSYAIIRPGGLADGTALGPAKIELNQGDTISGEVNRADVAQCAVEAALSTKIPPRVTFEIYQCDRKGPLENKFPKKSGYERLGSDYDAMFEGLQSGDIA